MNKDEVFNFLNKYSVAALATSDGEKPHLRYVWTIKSDENGIMFHTGRMKELFGQLENNSNIEFLFTNEKKDIQIRVSGTAELLNDEKIKQDLADSRPFLRDIEKQQGSLDFLVVFMLKNCMASVWTMETNNKTKEYVELN